MALAMQAAHCVKDVSNLTNPQVIRARTELVRLVNLMHILVCVAAYRHNVAVTDRRSTE
jgi:hypothetical protein